MPYTSEKPNIVPDVESLRRSIPGWGVDLDREDRPAVPKESYNPGATGAHWTFPERQIPPYKREMSTEHRFLTPVFGTTCPPRGLSGVIRRYAYTFSEGRTSHWTLLVLADRIDVLESKIIDLFRLHPPNPIGEFGLNAELKYHGLRSRIRQHRTDNIHVPIDVVAYFAKTIALGAGIFFAVRALRPEPKKRGFARLAARLALSR